METGSGAPVDDLLGVLREKAIGKDAVEDVLDYVLGWAKRLVDKHIEKQRPAVVSWEEFNRRDRSGGTADRLAPRPA